MLRLLDGYQHFWPFLLVILHAMEYYQHSLKTMHKKSDIRNSTGSIVFFFDKKDFSVSLPCNQQNLHIIAVRSPAIETGLCFMS